MRTFWRAARACLRSRARDVTAAFIAGGERAVAHALEHGCRHALLIDGSPSCGSGFIYDGSFAGARHPGDGVTAALLRRAGVNVFSDREIDRLAERINAEENKTAGL